jgi:hypothetical protein
VSATFVGAAFGPLFSKFPRKKPAVSLVMLAVLVSNLGLSRRWQDNVGHFSQSYLAIAEVNNMAQIEEVFVDLPDFATRMLAASLLRSPRIGFFELTYYGAGLPRSTPIPETARVLQLKIDAHPIDIPHGDLLVLSLN